MNKITAYRCDYCKRLFVLERNARVHEEKYCFRSPLARTCFTCKNWELDESSKLGYKFCNLGLDLEDADSGFFKVRKCCSSYEPNVDHIAEQGKKADVVAGYDEEE